ncbi:MAG: hypothetical protein ACRD04_00280 [Terriglobales bacterium]
MALIYDLEATAKAGQQTTVWRTQSEAARNGEDAGPDWIERERRRYAISMYETIERLV